MSAIRSARLRRGPLLATGIVALLALFLSLSAAAAPAERQAASGPAVVAKPNGQTPAFKRQLIGYLRRNERFALRLERSAGVKMLVVARNGMLPSAGFARARGQVEGLSLAQVAVLQRAFGRSAGQLTPPPDAARLTAALAVECDPDPNVAHDWGAILIAKEIAMGFVAAGSSTPAPLNIAFWTAWAAAQGTVEILTYQQITQEACEAEELNRELLRGAKDSQKTWNSVNLNIEPRVSYVAAFVNNTLEPWLTTTDTKLAGLATDLSAANTTLATHTTLLNSAHTKLDGVAGSLGTSTTGTVHVKLDNLATALTTVSNKVDTLQSTVVAGQDLDLRLKIEADLSQSSTHGIALFQVPQAQGGYLELARSIVADTIAKQRAAGQPVGQAASFLASGDAAMAAGAYKAAYDSFGKAYRQAAN